MQSDLEIIGEIELEIGAKLPMAELEGLIPVRNYYMAKRDGRKRTVSFDLMNSVSCVGYFVNESEQVVGCALCGLDLENLPTALAKLRSLKKINISFNSLSELPRWFFEIDALPSQASINTNPIDSPPVEIINQGKEAVLTYFDSLGQEGSMRLNEVKVLLVGDGGAGKTCLVDRLLDNKFDPLKGQTDGINIEPWSIKVAGDAATAHLWDFGGQEIMHATHQFFLSERSLYVLVLDGRKEEDAEYWLKHIESFGGDSPILVVLNKMDENPSFDVNRRFLEEKYPGIVGFFPISCKSNKGVAAFKKGLINAIGQVEILSTTWPGSWFRIKTQLEKMPNHFIGHGDYSRLCQDEELKDELSQETLVRFLHDLGVIVHFADFELEDMHVLEPRWLTGAVYRIVNSDELANSKGVLKLRALRSILKPIEDADYDYPSERHPYIINLMKKFEICYSINKQTVLLPDLLEVQEPEIDFDYEGSLKFRIDYDFLPKSIIPRFIVRKSASISDDLRWRTGVVIEDAAFSATAVIKSDDAARRIYIFVSGPQRRDYLTVIRSTFLDINRSFEKLDCKEKVPLPDDPEVTVSYDHLIRLEKTGATEYFPDGAEHPYDVGELLGALHVKEQRTEADLVRMLKSVVSETDDEKSLLKKADDLVKIQPGFFGVSVDIKKLIQNVLGWFSKRQQKYPKDIGRKKR